MAGRFRWAVAVAILVPAAAHAETPRAQPDGKALFSQKCGMCHRKGGMGTVLLARRIDPAQAELEKRTDLAPDYVVAAVRSGIGNMPRVPRGELGDADLDVIACYLSIKPAGPKAR